MDPQRALPEEMLQLIEVRAVRGFTFDDLQAVAGEMVMVTRARGEYLKFLGLVELV